MLHNVHHVSNEPLSKLSGTFVGFNLEIILKYVLFRLSLWMLSLGSLKLLCLVARWLLPCNGGHSLISAIFFLIGEYTTRVST